MTNIEAKEKALQVVDKYYSMSVMVYNNDGELSTGALCLNSAIQCAIKEVEAIIQVAHRLKWLHWQQILSELEKM